MLIRECSRNPLEPNITGNDGGMSTGSGTREGGSDDRMPDVF